MPRNINRGPLPTELGFLIDMLDDFEERIRTLEAPSGEALANTVRTLESLVANIQAQLDAYLLTRYTNDQIDARILALIASHMAGNVSIGGALNVLGTLDVAGAVTMPSVFTTNIVPLGGSRFAAWVRDGGRLGHT